MGSKFAAYMWVYTEAVLCDGHGPPPEDLRRILVVIGVCVSWVCEEHEWVTELNGLLKEKDFGSIEL